MNDSANCDDPTAPGVEPAAGAEVSVEPRSVDIAAGNLRRLSGHARLIGAAIALAVKLSISAMLALIWFVTVQDSRNMGFQSQAETLVGLAVLSAVTIIATHVCSLDIRRSALLSALTAVCCAFGYLLLQWAMLPYSATPISCSHELAAGAAILLGGSLGHLLACLSRSACQRLMQRGHFPKMAAGLGVHPGGNALRADVEAVLARTEQACARGLLTMRMMVVCGAAILLLMAGVAIGQGLDRIPGAGFNLGELSVGLIVGSAFGVIAGIAMLPAPRQVVTLALASSIAGLMAPGLVIGAFLAGHPRAIAVAGWPMCEALLVMIGASVPIYWITTWFARLLLRHVLPAPIAVHIAGSAEPPAAVEPPSHASALACEVCGYRLEGLPPFACPTCGVEELRCPECGHQQPAQTLHARALLRICKLHLGLRVVSWLAGLALTLLLLLPWFVIGLEVRGGSLFNGRFDLAEVLGLAMGCFVLLAPVRLLMLHWRPVAVFSLVLPMLPLIAVCMGGWLSGRGGGPPEDVIVLVVIWLLVSVATPLLWRAWLWLMMGAPARDVWAWHTSRAFRRGDAQRMMREARGLGALCETGQMLTPCPVCDVLRHSESADGGAVSLARIAFESMVHRTRQMLLAITAAGTAVACGVMAVTLLVRGSEFGYMGFGILGEGELAPLVLIAMSTGALLRASTIRWHTIASSLGAGSFALFWFVAPVVFSRAYGGAKLGLAVGVSGLVMMAAFIGALLTVPALTLVSRLFIPAGTLTALTAWLRGEKPMDAAAESL